MKIWLEDCDSGLVVLSARNPTGSVVDYSLFCKRAIRTLLKGSGICLPRLNSNQVVEVEITACRPKTAKRSKR